MDEISYWISTKQAPCLFNYDNVIKRQCEQQARCSKTRSVQSILLDTPKKKKKRKLSLLDDDDEDSVATEKQQNMYFDTSQNRNHQTFLDCDSASSLTDLDFNIKSSSIQNKSKKAKLKNTARTSLHKKNKVLVTSTPKVAVNLRRSQRKAQQSTNNNTHLNNSFEMFNCEIINGNRSPCKLMSAKRKPLSKVDKSPELFAGGDQSIFKLNCNGKSCETQPVKIQSNQFDDMSDVSGFTANYIRSTKMNSSKKLRNIRGEGNKNLIKEAKQNEKNDKDSVLVCLNKSINTGLPNPALLNCSTDSSQNVINLVTLKKNKKSLRVSRSTSVLKFMDIKNSNVEENQTSKHINNTSFQSKSSTPSRYPKRHKNSSAEDINPAKYEKKHPQSKITLDKRRKISKNAELNHSGHKENPQEKIISKTRSGKCIGLTLQQADNSVLVLSNSFEPVSSLASMNVASPTNIEQVPIKTRRRNCNKKRTEITQKKDRSGLQRDSLRDKSGFAACFSESDEDNECVKKKKFFC